MATDTHMKTSRISSQSTQLVHVLNNKFIPRLKFEDFHMNYK